MDDKLLIGIVTKPQGIKGEIKIKNLADSVESLKGVTLVYIDGVSYKILGMRSSGEDVFLSLKGVADRNVAETLRGKELYALREEIVKDEQSFFIVDVIGCKVVTDSGEVIGTITEILPYRTDVYYVKGDKGTAIFPMLKKLEPVYDIPNKTVTVNGERLKEIVLYEN